MAEAKEWLLIKRDLYWRPNGQGYTGIRDHAGRYTFEEAKELARDGGGVTMIKASDAPEFSNACFDDLARAHLRQQRDGLLEALKTIMGDYEHGQGMMWLDRCRMARDAIANATGKSATDADCPTEA